MYEIRIDRQFCAAHAIVMRGEREPLHGHTWRVVLTVSAPELDDDGLVLDFHDLDRRLAAILTPWHNANLNDVEPFTGLNPTAENVARWIAEQIGAALEAGLTVERVDVTEAPGCVASYVRRAET